MEAIRIEALTKKYKDVIAVDQLSMTIEKGELISLLGVNGAGKTTTIKMLSCLTRPSSGDAYLLGKSIIQDEIDVKKIIAVSPQETAIAPGLSVKENLEMMYGVYGFAKVEKVSTNDKTTELAKGSCGNIAMFDVPDKIAAMAKKTAEKMTSKVAEAQAAVTTAKTKLSENPDPSTEEGRKAINETGTDEQKAGRARSV